MQGLDELAGLVEDLTPQVVELHRSLHQNPEPAHREYRTTNIIGRYLSTVVATETSMGGDLSPVRVWLSRA